MTPSVNKKLAIATGILVFCLSIICFSLSFAGLYDLIKDYGIYPSWMNFLWPVVLDGAIICFSLYLVWATISGIGKQWWTWTLILSATAASIALNIYHAGDVLGAQIVSAFPPLLGFLAFEQVMRMLRYSVELSASEEVARVEAEEEDLDEVSVLSDLIPDMESSLSQKEILAKRREAVANFRQAGHTNVSLMAEALGVDAKTIYRDIDWLKSRGKVGSKVPPSVLPKAA